MNRDRIVHLWRDGILLECNAVEQLIDVLDYDNLDAELAQLPDQLTAGIRRQIESRPRTDKEWSELRLLFVGGVCGFMSQQERQAFYAPRKPSVAELDDMRTETEELRSYFAETDK